MSLQDIVNNYQISHCKLQLKLFQCGSPYIAITPEDQSHIKLAMTAAYDLGHILIVNKLCKSFNAGINTQLLDSQNALSVEIYLVPSILQSGNLGMVNTEILSTYFYTDSPHLESHLIDNYFKNKRGGMFLDTQVGDGVSNCPTRFFEEFYGWCGLNLEENYFDLLYKNRNLSSSVNVFGSLTSKSLTDMKTKLTYKSLITTYLMERLDWMNIRETGLKLLEVLDGMENSPIYPNLITLTYKNKDKVDIHTINSKLESIGYKLDSVYFNNYVFVLN